MSILLYVKLLWCSSIPYISGQLEGGSSTLCICAFWYMLNLCSVVVSIDLWSIGGGGLGICAFCYM